MMPHERQMLADIQARLKERGKGCGDCTACCTIMAVEMAPLPEPNKLERTKCWHLCKQGCSIYENKPESCTVFMCLWLAMECVDPGMPASWRPDRVGAVVDVNEVGTVTVHLKHENAWQKPGPLRDMILYLAKGGSPLSNNRFVVLDRPSGDHLLVNEFGETQELVAMGVGPTGNRVYRTKFRGEA